MPIIGRITKHVDASELIPEIKDFLRKAKKKGLSLSDIRSELYRICLDFSEESLQEAIFKVLDSDPWIVLKDQRRY